MLELNIATAAPKPPPKPPPKPRPPKPPVEPQEIGGEGFDDGAPSEAAARAAPPLSRKRKTAPVAPAPAEADVPLEVPETAPALPPKSGKKSRYAPTAASADWELQRKRDDPSRAPALPSTMPLDTVRTSAVTFSATTFDALPIERYLARHLTERMALTHLTPVQQHAIPELLRGGDLLVRSPTGSGKTLAYAVPIVHALIAKGAGVVTRAAGTFVIVLVPTRELCMQTHEVVEKLANPFPWLVTSALVGGEKRKAEKARLRKGVALIVGTPGRVADHTEATSACVAQGWNSRARA